MTAKHKPATALPVVYRQAIMGHKANWYLRWKNLDSIVPSEQDAAYLVHAANAYPQLVQALRETLRDRLTQANLHQLPPGIRSRLESARALLRSLGEAE